jgi:hypothetical protein
VLERLEQVCRERPSFPGLAIALKHQAEIYAACGDHAKAAALAEERDRLLGYTAEDFPCPDPTPGGKQHNGAYSGWLDPAPEGDEIAFAVVVPKGSSSEAELKAIGEQLQHWKSAKDFVRRIIGIEQLLRGDFPETPADLFWLPIPPLTEKVALVYPTRAANCEQTGASLSQALGGLSVAMVVSPAYYSQINW